MTHSRVTPQHQGEAMSLTDEQIDKAYMSARSPKGPQWTSHLEGLRAIESAATAPLLERIAELERELEAARKDAQWRTIETAPKDGTLLLLWEQYDTEPFVGSYGLDGVWYASTTYYNTDGDACVVDTVCSDGVTHWMPLPPAPDAAKEQG